MVKNYFFAGVAASAICVGIGGTAKAQVFSFDGATSKALIVDEARDNLLISTDGGDILRFDLGIQAFLDPIDVGGEPLALAIDPVSGFLFGANEQSLPGGANGLGVLNRIDLDTNVVTDLTFPLVDFSDVHSFDVAFARTGVGFFTTGDSNWTPLRQVDGAGAISIRTEPGIFGADVRAGTFLTADQSGRFILVNESNISSFPLHVYDANSDQFISTTDNFATQGLPSFANGLSDVSGSADRVAVAFGGTVTLLDLNLEFVSQIQDTSQSIAGLAFSPDGSTLYVLDSNAGAVIGYDTSTGSEVTNLLTLNVDFPSFSFFERSSNLLTIDAAGENLFIDFGTGFERINFATFRSFCEFTTPGDGGAVLCDQETTREFVSDLSDLTVTVGSSGVFNGFRSFDFDGANTTFINEGEVSGQIEFAISDQSDDTLINRGVLSGDVQFREGQDELINEAGGVIEGRVGMGRGDDIVRLLSGSEVGAGAEIRLGFGDDLVIIEEGSVFEGFVSDDRSTGSGDIDTVDVRATGVNLSRFSGIEVFNLDTTGEIRVPENTSFFGETVNLIGGGLRVDGVARIEGLTSAAGTTIAGVGSLIVAEGALVVNGTIAPSSRPSLGTAGVAVPTDTILSIVGDLEFASGSVLVAQVFEEDGAAAANDALDVTGGVDISSGATLDVRAGGGELSPGANEVSVLSASEGVTGEFSTVSLPTNFALSDISYDDGLITVAFRSQFGAGLELSAAAAGIGAYLDDLSFAMEQESTDALLRDLLSVTDVATLEAAFQDLSAEAYAGADQINVESGLALIDTVGRAIGGDAVRRGEFVPWVSAAVASVDQDADAISGADLDSRAGLFGFSYGVSDTVAVGLFAGAWTFEQAFDGIAATAEGDGFAAGGFLTANSGPASLKAVAAFASATSDVSRRLGFFDRTAQGEVDLDAVSFGVEGAYRFEVGGRIAVSPTLGATYISSDRGEAREADGGVAGLEVDDAGNGFLFTQAGVALSTVKPLAGRVTPFIETGVRYEVLGANSEASAALIGESLAYLVRGLDIERARIYSDVGLSVDIAKGLALSAAYRGRFGDDLTSHGATAAIRMSF